MEIAGVNLIIAFVAGLASCVSPCVLPLAPIYFSNLLGSSAGGVNNSRNGTPLVHTLAFMAGFLTLFVILGTSVGLVGYVLRDHLSVLQKVGGFFLITMGLHTSGVIQFAFLYRGLGFDWPFGDRGPYLRSFFSGSAISAGWLPCIGPTLGAILTLALTSSTVLESSVLLTAYSLGLAVPFVAFGLLLTKTPRLTTWFVRHHVVTNGFAGAFMVLTGVLLFTGALQRLNAYFNFSNSGLGSAF